MRILMAVLALLSLSLPLSARPLSEAEAAGLTKALEGFFHANTSGEAARIVATLPPRVVNVFAGTAGIEADAVQATLTKQTAELMKKTKVSEFVAAPGPYDASDAKLTDGSAVVWVVVSTQFVTTTDRVKSRNSQPLFAVLEGDHWYFSRVDGPQQQQLLSFAYPFIAEAKLPASSVTPLQ